MYDIIFIGNSSSSFLKLKERFPTAKQVAIKTSILDSFNEAKKKAFTKMFWVVWDDVLVDDNFKFDYKVEPWDEQYNHLFLNGAAYDGICLFSKLTDISNRELSCRFFINKKEIAICASTPISYDIVYVKTYDDYLNALKNATTDLFWIIPTEVTVAPDFKFDLYFDHHNQYDRKQNHAFKNGECYDGIILASKSKVISKRELDYRFLIEKKEWDIIASNPAPYAKFYINTYEEYLEALETADTGLFWIIPSDVTPVDDFKFDLYFRYSNQYDRQLNHVFKNGEYYDGIILASKKTPIVKREFDYRFLVEKKEWDIVASLPKPFDIVFISYFEKLADENFQNLLDKVGNTHSVYRVNGVKGIHQAHRAAAEIAQSDLFWVVDADAILEPTFNFEFPQVVYHDTYTKSIVHVWRSRNPINNLEYGYGGVKLLPRQLTLNMDLSKPDMTTSISASFKVMDEVSNITAFNTDAFSAWRSAFRECVKLSSRVIDRQNDEETMTRMAAWLEYHPGKPFSSEASSGAFDGIKYGRESAADPAALALINDFDWLKNYYQQIR